MQLLSIKGDAVTLLYHATETPAGIGEQFALVEQGSAEMGLVVQVISHQSLDYPGLGEQAIQHILEARLSKTEVPFDRERGMDAIMGIKVAECKIRKRIDNSKWQAWDGWIPSRSVTIRRIEADELLQHVLPTPRFPLPSFARFRQSSIRLDGSLLDKVTVITGIKGSGKSHLGKLQILGLAERSVPVVIFDFNGEYDGLPGAQSVQWGNGFQLRLSEVGWPFLVTVVRALCPLQSGSPAEAAFENMLPNAFKERRAYCVRRDVSFTIDVEYLRDTVQWSGSNNTYVHQAITDRLDIITDKALFAQEVSNRAEGTSPPLSDLYEGACVGRPLVFDLRELSDSERQALVKAVLRWLEGVCDREVRIGSSRLPYVFFDEAHFYVREEAILGLITRGRHIGMASVFITNTPSALPAACFRQLDNLFLTSLSHKDDIRAVSQIAFTDAETIASMATRMPFHHALVIGSVTNRYPLIVEVEPLPAHIPPTGQTRSTWDRFAR